MKKIISIILALIMCIGLVSCQTPNTEEPISEEPTASPEKIEYSIYLDNASSLGGESSDIGIDVSVFNDSYDLNIRYLYMYDQKNETVPATKTFEFDGRTFTMDYASSFYPKDAIGSEKSLQNYFINSDDGNYVADFDAITGRLVRFITVKDKKKYEGSFTEEDAKEKSKKYILENFGENSLNNYEISHLSKDSDGNVSIGYKKFLCGIECTTDYISIYFRPNGEIYRLNADQFGVVDNHMMNKITKERIEDAEACLIKSIPEDFEVGSSRNIVVDFTTGICYLEISAKNTSHELSLPFLINIF